MSRERCREKDAESEREERREKEEGEEMAGNKNIIKLSQTKLCSKMY